MEQINFSNDLYSAKILQLVTFNLEEEFYKGILWNMNFRIVYDHVFSQIVAAFVTVGITLRHF